MVAVSASFAPKTKTWAAGGGWIEGSSGGVTKGDAVSGGERHDGDKGKDNGREAHGGEAEHGSCLEMWDSEATRRGR